MNNQDYIAKHISDTSTMSPEDVMSNATMGYGEEQPTLSEPPMPRWSPMDMAQVQGQKQIIETVQRKDAQRQADQEMSRIARAVAEATKPTVEVGKVTTGGRVVGTPLAPPTIPESRETIKAGMAAVGIQGRKGVYSELPFEAEDVPEGWDVIQTADGGYLANPKEFTQEVVANEKAGDRYKSLGYTQDKPEEADQVISVKNKDGVVVQDEATTQEGGQKAVENAFSIADNIEGTVSIRSPQEALKERVANKADEVSQVLWDNVKELESSRSKVYHDSARDKNNPAFKGYKTVGVGFNMEQAGARKVWDEAGVSANFDDVFNGKTELTDDDQRKLLGVTYRNAQSRAAARAKQVGVVFDNLPDWHKEILTDIAFNVKDMSQWTRVFKSTHPVAVLREARRKDSGNFTKGMDNRVTKLALSLNLIDSVEEARTKLGLKLADVDPRTVARIIQRRKKAQPTLKLAGER